MSAVAELRFAPSLSGRERRMYAREFGVTWRLGWRDRLLTRMSGFSRTVAAGALSWAFGKAETIYKKPEKVFLALLTGVPTSSSTGTTIEAEEASYTGHERKELTGKLEEAVEGATSTIKNELEIVFAACTAGSSTIVAFAVTTLAAKGTIVCWGTTASTTISTTQTPATVAAKALEASLK